MSYRQLHTSLWSEPWFEPFSPYEKLAAIYLMHHPNLSPAGFVHITPERMAFETHIPAMNLESAISGIMKSGRFWYFEKHHVFWVVRSWRWQGFGDNWERGVKKNVLSMPSEVQDVFFSFYDRETLTPSPKPLTPQHIQYIQYNTDVSKLVGSNPLPTPLPPPPSSKKLKEPLNQRCFQGNIFLSEDEHLKLIERFGDNGVEERIEALALYMKSKGKKYKDHYATILNWERMNDKKTQQGDSIVSSGESVKRKKEQWDAERANKP